MLPWKLRKRHILPASQNLLSVYFSLAKFQLVSCNLSLAMIWQRTLTHELPKLCSATLSKDVFERRTSTGSEAFFLFICLDAIKFSLLTFFSLLKTIYPRVLTKPLPNDAKSSLPVDVLRSKMLLLKVPNAGTEVVETTVHHSLTDPKESTCSLGSRRKGHRVRLFSTKFLRFNNFEPLLHIVVARRIRYDLHFFTQG